MTSMRAITAMQLAYSTLAYFGTLYALPTLACKKQMRGMETPMRLLFCVIFGNFWIINAVLLMFTLRFCNGFSLFMTTWGLAFGIWVYQNRRKVLPFLNKQRIAFTWLVRGELKGMLYLRRGAGASLKLARAGAKRSLREIAPRSLELILIALITGFNVWYFSYQTFFNQGFGISDMPVHAYWIDSMINGDIFCDGVYPFGFHCAIYYVVEVFNIDLVYLMRVFGPIQTVLAFFTIYLFMRTICKSRYAPIAAYMALSITPAVSPEFAFMRSQFTLPQEFGMIFILPMGAFMAEFMKRYLDGGENPNICLYMFGAAFSLTIAVHFYVTFLAAMMCFGACAAYFPMIFKPKLFGKILLCGVISVMIAVAPLAIAYVTGTELQPSLMWALSVMDFGDEEEEVTEEIVVEDTAIEEPEAEEGGGIVALIKNIPSKWYRFFGNATTGQWKKISLLLLLLVTGCCGFGLLIKRLRRHSQAWLMVAGYVYCTCFLGCMGSLGLPALLEGYRINPFLSFGVCLLYGYPFELMCLMPKTRKFADALVAVSLCAFLGVAFLKPDLKFKKNLNYYSYLQHAGDITIVYDLIDNYPDQKWTLVSTVSELYQIYSQHGWHYEITDFIQEQRNWHEGKTLTIPTEYVFILVEKRCFQYNVTVRVDAKAAMLDVERDMAALPLTIIKGSNSVYNTKETRAQLMAHLMAWVDAFNKMYPNELTLYYEDEDVICYRLIQNPYSLYNLSVNYGYNTRR